MTSDPTQIKLKIATADDVVDLVSLRAAVNQHLIAQFGKGYWASGLTEKGVLFAMRTAAVYAARGRNRLIATVTLSARKPWAIDKKYFSARTQPLYLTAMALHPNEQRKGLGRLCIEDALRIARKLAERCDPAGCL